MMLAFGHTLPRGGVSENKDQTGICDMQSNIEILRRRSGYIECELQQQRSDLDNKDLFTAVSYHWQLRRERLKTSKIKQGQGKINNSTL